jgi:hypothetical protein
MLTVITKDEVALPERASGNELNGIDRAGVVLHDGNEFLVLRSFRLKFPERRFGNPVSECKAGAKMAVKLDYVAKIFIVQFIHGKLLKSD